MLIQFELRMQPKWKISPFPHFQLNNNRHHKTKWKHGIFFSSTLSEFSTFSLFFSFSALHSSFLLFFFFQKIKTLTHIWTFPSFLFIFLIFFTIMLDFSRTFSLIMNTREKKTLCMYVSFFMYTFFSTFMYTFRHFAWPDDFLLPPLWRVPFNDFLFFCFNVVDHLFLNGFLFWFREFYELMSCFSFK